LPVALPVDDVNSPSCGMFSTGTRVFFGFFGILDYERVRTHLAPVWLPRRGLAGWQPCACLTRVE